VADGPYQARRQPAGYPADAEGEVALRVRARELDLAGERQ